MSMPHNSDAADRNGTQSVIFQSFRHRLAPAIVIALGLRLCYLLSRYILGHTGLPYSHLDGTAFLLVALGLFYRLSRHRRDVTCYSGSPVHPLLALTGFCALSFALYWPALSVGFLSDDFQLADRASNWQLGVITLELFRPAPLSLWAALLDVGAGAKTFHALNIALHGINAGLTMQVASHWLQRHDWLPICAGVLMLVTPLAPEAVVWCAGVFDVMATTFVLGAVLTSRQYEDGATSATRAAYVSFALIALMSKETAAVLPVLALLDAWVRRALCRRFVGDTLVLFGMFATIGLIRLAFRFGTTPPELGHSAVRRVLFRSFGGLALPWHVDVVEAFPIVVLLSTLLIAGLLLAFLLRAGRLSSSRVALACALWVIASILPVFHMLFIGADLQSARYLYLASVGWAIMLAAFAGDVPMTNTSSRLAVRTAIVVLSCVMALGVRLHLQPWLEAAALRDLVMRQASRDSHIKRCDRVVLTNLPDSVRGAYVFRVGAPEAFTLVLGIQAVVGTEAGPCTFRWNHETQAFSANP